jgi:CRP-like cAMP-binding protein
MRHMFERLMFLQEIFLFQDMPSTQLKIVAAACEEISYPEGTVILDDGAIVDALYIIVNGKVSLELKNRATGKTSPLGVLESKAYFGETLVFDASESEIVAVAQQDTLVFRLDRRILIGLFEQYPGLSLQFIKALSNQMREVDTQLAELAPTRSRKMHKVFDKLDFGS